MNKPDHLKLSHPATEFLTITLISLSLMGSALAQSSPTEHPDAPAAEAASIMKGSSNDLSTMLPFLITSPDRERLAAELLSSLERGDLKQAEASLNTAIEAGTLAIALIDRLHDPDLRSTLENLGLKALQRTPAPSAACNVLAQPIATNLAEMQEALDREHSYSDTISRALTDLTGQYNTLAARLETESSDTALKVSKLQHALQQERQQRETIVQELADARQELHNLQPLKSQEAEAAIRIAELEDILSQAQTRGDDFAQKLADATQALHSLQEAQEQNASSPTPGPAQVKAETFTALRDDAPSPSSLAAASKETSVVSMKDEPAAGAVTSALPIQEAAPVVIAQLPEAVRPLSTARVAPVDPPASTKPAPVPIPKASPPLQETKRDDRLTARADELFRKGDVSGARLLLEHALKNGNARAAFLLAETFDPHVLSKLGVRGIRGDASKARDYYAQAQALGMSQASERMEALK